jgi:two-component system nitrogen regulation response regulator NtrX
MSRQAKRTVLIVDDEARVRRSLVEFLDEEGFRVLEAPDTKTADKVLAQEAGEVDAILLDVRMPAEDGVAWLQRREDLTRSLPVIMMSGHGTIELAVEAVRLGAFDFLEKGFTPERLSLTLERALEVTALRRQNLALKEERGALHRMVGSSPPLEELLGAVRRAAPTPAKVLILGENGVGKELVARAIHDLSPRADGPFVRLNCAAIPRDLVESELFGHEKGAFTGADAQKKGKLELAHTGTLFLDEVGDMGLEAQAKLLRALESNEFERVGGTRTLSFDSRLIAATNKDLGKEVAEGRFRRDLYYRLNVLPIHVPPLRERGTDIPLLVEHYLGYFREEYGRPRLRLDEKALAHLARYPWPGNVRELRNLVERVVIMAPGEEVGASTVAGLLGAEPGTAPGTGGNLSLDLDREEAREGEGLLKGMLEAAEKEILRAELERTGWNVSQAARNLGIDRANLHRKLRRLDLSRD